MKTIDFSYFIERYLAGEMDEAEKKWFHKEIEDNENLRREVELRKRTDLILKEQDVMDLRMKLKSIEKSRMEASALEKPPAPKSRHLNMKYAAVVASFVIIGSFALFHNGKLTNDAIIEQYYKSYDAVTYSRSGESAENADYNLALEYYKIHDYRNAAVYFSKVLEDEPDNMQTALLNGISNFENRNYPVAEGSFVKVIKDDNNLYIDYAQWYLALCYIQTNEKKKAVTQLTLIAKSEGIYKKDARKILRQLK